MHDRAAGQPDRDLVEPDVVVDDQQAERHERERGRQDEQAASNMGINVVYVKNIVFIISAMLAAAAGVFNGHLTRILTPAAGTKMPEPEYIRY